MISVCFKVVRKRLLLTAVTRENPAAIGLIRPAGTGTSFLERMPCFIPYYRCCCAAGNNQEDEDAIGQVIPGIGGFLASAAEYEDQACWQIGMRWSEKLTVLESLSTRVMLGLWRPVIANNLFVVRRSHRDSNECLSSLHISCDGSLGSGIPSLLAILTGSANECAPVFRMIFPQ